VPRPSRIGRRCGTPRTLRTNWWGSPTPDAASARWFHWPMGKSLWWRVVTMCLDKLTTLVSPGWWVSWRLFVGGGVRPALARSAGRPTLADAPRVDGACNARVLRVAGSAGESRTVRDVVLLMLRPHWSLWIGNGLCLNSWRTV